VFREEFDPELQTGRRPEQIQKRAQAAIHKQKDQSWRPHGGRRSRNRLTTDAVSAENSFRRGMRCINISGNASTSISRRNPRWLRICSAGNLWRHSLLRCRRFVTRSRLVQSLRFFHCFNHGKKPLEMQKEARKEHALLARLVSVMSLTFATVIYTCNRGCLRFSV
jgi:hypothetical protein